MNQQVRFGILGAGGIAKSFARGIASAKGATLYAVASRDLQKAEAFKQEFNAEIAYGTYEELVQDAQVDVIYVATPNSLHKDHAILCMKHGKGVICEKPLASNYKEGKEMVEAAKANDVFFMEAMWTRFFPLIKQVKKWIEEGKIGEVKMLQGDFGFAGRGKDDIRFNQQLAGGALMDVGIYPVSFASYIYAKQPCEIKALGLIGETGVDERATAIFKYDQGEMASIGTSIITKTPREMFIMGEKGYIHIPNVWQAKECFVHIEGQDVEHISMPFEGNGYNYEVEEVVACIQEGKKQSTVISHAESLAIMQTMDQIRQEIGLVFPADNL
jgi:predicted dehydrogenase